MQETNPSRRVAQLRALLFGTCFACACSAQIDEHPDSSGGTGNPPLPGSGAPASNGGSGQGTGGSSGQGTGGSTNVPPPDIDAATCAASNNAVSAGLTRLRRLTRDQFNNTVRDLLGATGNPADALAPDERMGPFASNAIAPITELLVEQHSEVAAKLAEDATARMKQLSPCDLAADTGMTCAADFVKQFGARAFRRPLTNDEVTDYTNLYAVGKPTSASNGFRLVVQALLQSPFFLYHHDVGATNNPQAKTVAVTAHELASRLSYFLWNSMPDTELFARAGDGSLNDEATIRSQVQRMLKDGKAQTTVALFHKQWLALDDLATRDKDTALFPSYSSSLVDAMQQETAFFTNAVILNGDGLLKTLLTSNVAYPQGKLFEVYGVTQPANFKAGTPVTLPATERAGILTQAAFLTRNAHRNQSSPVHRGLTVRENLLCQPIPAPPDAANTAPPQPTAATTTRERFLQHQADATCRSCHERMDLIGLGFENYDAIGRFRTQDGTSTVDPSGEFLNTRSDLSGKFNGALELGQKLAASSEVADCVANQWFRFSLGRLESTDDACSVVGIRERFKTSGGNVRELLAEIAVSVAFRNVRATGK